MNNIERGKPVVSFCETLSLDQVHLEKVTNPEEYLWTSYQARVLGKDTFGLLDTVDF